MRPPQKLPVIITVLIIFLVGAIVGMWIKNRPAVMMVEPSTPAYQPLESGEAVVMRVYREISPAVVNIVTTSLALNFWRELEPRVGQGSGFVIDKEGHILTNNHVVAKVNDIDVTFTGGHKLQARLLARDSVSDVAVLKVEPFEGMAVAPLGDSDHLEVGQRVVAIGNPFGFQHTVTTGFISALHRDINLPEQNLTGMVQTDAVINPGNSGGPLIDSRGKVIAINQAIYTQSGGFMGIGLALPINRAKKVANQLIKWGRAIYPWIGVQMSMDITPAIAERMGISPVSGILIYEVVPGSPAAIAGLKGGDRVVILGGRRPIILGGDVIISADGKPTPGYDELRAILLQKNVGDKIQLGIVRGKTDFMVEVTTTADPRLPR